MRWGRGSPLHPYCGHGEPRRCGLDSGLIVVLFITAVYIALGIQNFITFIVITEIQTIIIVTYYYDNHNLNCCLCNFPMKWFVGWLGGLLIFPKKVGRYYEVC